MRKKKDAIITLLRKRFLKHLALLFGMSCICLLFLETALVLLNINVFLEDVQVMSIVILSDGLFMSLSSVIARSANQVHLPANIISIISIIAYVIAAEVLTHSNQELGMAFSYAVFWIVFYITALSYLLKSRTYLVGG